MADHPSHKKREGGLTENEAYWIERREEAKDILRDQKFDIAIGVVILCNAATIGIEQTLELRNQDTTPIQVIETIFLVVYIFEFGLRQFGYGIWYCMRDAWVRFDFFLVCLGLVTTMMSIAGQSADALGPLMVLRSARLLRLAKTARMLMKFREFWMLIRGLLNSLGVMFYTLTILTAILYVFGSVAIELITKHSRADRTAEEFNEKFSDHVDQYFSSLPQAMVTLLQFVCVDNMAEVYKPLVEQDPTLALYFITLILVVTLMFTNLITAVIVNSTLEQNILDKEVSDGDETMMFKALVDELREMFTKLDVDQSGRITQAEFLHIKEEDKETLCRAMQVDSPHEIFKALDIDHSGYVNIGEFCDGIWQVIMSKAPPEVKRMEKQVNVMHWHLKETDAIRQGMLQDVITEIKEIKLSLKKAFRKGGPLCGAGAAAAAPISSLAPVSVLDEANTPFWALDMMRELKSLRKCSQSPPLDGSQEMCTSTSRMASPASRMVSPATSPAVSPRGARNGAQNGKRESRRAVTPRETRSPRPPPIKTDTLAPLLASQLSSQTETPPDSPQVVPPKASGTKTAKSPIEPSPTTTLKDFLRQEATADPGGTAREAEEKEDIPGAGAGAAARSTKAPSGAREPSGGVSGPRSRVAQL